MSKPVRGRGRARGGRGAANRSSGHSPDSESEADFSQLAPQNKRLHAQVSGSTHPVPNNATAKRFRVDEPVAPQHVDLTTDIHSDGSKEVISGGKPGDARAASQGVVNQAPNPAAQPNNDKSRATDQCVVKRTTGPVQSGGKSQGVSSSMNQATAPSTQPRNDKSPEQSGVKKSDSLVLSVGKPQGVSSSMKQAPTHSTQPRNDNPKEQSGVMRSAGPVRTASINRIQMVSEPNGNPDEMSTGLSAPGRVDPALTFPSAVVMIGAPLLSQFGCIDRPVLIVLERFFMCQSTFGNEYITNGIHQLSVALQRANDTYLSLVEEHEMTIKRASDIHTEKSRLEQLAHSSSVENQRLLAMVAGLESDVTNMRETGMVTLQAENAKLKARIGELEDMAVTAKRTTDEILKARDLKITGLESRLKELDDEKLASVSELREIRKDMDNRIMSLETELNDMKQKSNLVAEILSDQVDPISKIQYRCPVIQNNGIVRSLEGVIQIWSSGPDMNTHAYRMFKCPVTHNFAVIAAFPIVDAFLKFERALGINTDPPLAFEFKVSIISIVLVAGITNHSDQAAGRGWTTYSFNEQLELIARLCNVYCNRNIASTPPEQLTTSVAGLSCMVTMRAVANGSRWDLQCHGVQASNGERVEIRVVFDSSWTNPFTDMDFPN